jgi:hypothetical protein
VKRGRCRLWMPGASAMDDLLRPGRPPQHQYRIAQAGLRAHECDARHRDRNAFPGGTPSGFVLRLVLAVPLRGQHRNRDGAQALRSPVSRLNPLCASTPGHLNAFSLVAFAANEQLDCVDFLFRPASRDLVFYLWASLGLALQSLATPKGAQTCGLCPSARLSSCQRRLIQRCITA